jgi:hypothetical protein
VIGNLQETSRVKVAEIKIQVLKQGGNLETLKQREWEQVEQFKGTYTALPALDTAKVDLIASQDRFEVPLKELIA